jgi:hypothetical protein
MAGTEIALFPIFEAIEQFPGRIPEFRAVVPDFGGQFLRLLWGLFFHSLADRP